jgi:hypothetical protein
MSCLKFLAAWLFVACVVYLVYWLVIRRPLDKDDGQNSGDGS